MNIKISNSNARLLTLTICAFIFIFGFFCAKKVFTLPSVHTEMSIALLCDYAENENDILRIQKISEKYLQSSWWKDYVNSRFLSKSLKASDNIFALTKDINDTSLKAYVLANFALKNPKTQYSFYQLGDRDAHFASLIYMINKNIELDKKYLTDFKQLHLKNLSDAKQKYYANVLITEAKKNASQRTLILISETFPYDLDYTYLDLVLKGADLNSFEFKQNTDNYKLLNKAKLAKTNEEKSEIIFEISKRNQKYKYWYIHVKLIFAECFYAMDMPQKADEAFADYYYEVARGDKNFEAVSIKNAIFFYAQTNNIFMIKTYILANASNLESMQEYRFFACQELLRQNQFSEAIDLLENSLGFKNLLKENYLLPRFP